jgi:pimeloyl-ACP methyl ester carboxylesterase
LRPRSLTITVGVIGVIVLGLASPSLARAAEDAGTGTAIQWKPCGAAPPDGGGTPEPGAECGTVTVPVDWSKPDGEKIEISVARRKATDPAARIGTLLMDPGGPGGPGAQQVRNVPDLFSADVRRRYDVIGFDPRGVGDSHPVLCSATALRPPSDVTSEAQFAAHVADNRALRANCRAHTGKLYDFVDTASVVQDMDAIRAALGERKLNYYGISYGTLMGQQYAERFPQRVGRFVLDSNMDHSLPTTKDFLVTAARSAQATFGQYADWCARTAACALHGSDVRAVHRELLDRAERGKLPGDTPGEQSMTPLQYLDFVNHNSHGPTWYYLAETMRGLRDGAANPAVAAQAGESLRALSTPARSNAAQPPAGPDTVPDPFAAVFCADWAVPIRDFAELQRLRQAQEHAAPDMKLSISWGIVLSCLGVGDRVRNPQHSLHVKGADPFLFVNSQYDPATPHEWAATAARQAGQTLLTYDGWGHFAYDKKSPCVVGTVDQYLFTGKLPAQGTHCPAVEPAPPAKPGTDPTAPGAQSVRPGTKLPRPGEPWPGVGGWLG